MNEKLICSIFFAIFFFSVNSKNNSIFAHNFNTDDNSSFLTLVNKILIENRLLNDSLTTNTNIGNSEAFVHTKNIKKILNDIVISEESFNFDSDQFYNNTIIALVVANLADEVLRNYGHAFGVPSNIMLSMNFSKISKIQNMSSNNMDMSTHFNHTADQENITSMIDKFSYLNAIRITDRMIELYNSDLKSFSSNSIDVDRAKSRLVDALINLKKDLGIKASPYRIMEVIHGEIHPNLQIAFNLTLKR
jgi:hypothetical protein